MQVVEEDLPPWATGSFDAPRGTRLSYLTGHTHGAAWRHVVVNGSEHPHIPLFPWDRQGIIGFISMLTLRVKSDAHEVRVLRRNVSLPEMSGEFGLALITYPETPPWVQAVIDAVPREGGIHAGLDNSGDLMRYAYRTLWRNERDMMQFADLYLRPNDIQHSFRGSQGALHELHFWRL